MSRQLAELGITAALAVAVVVSGVWLVSAQHGSRQLFIELEALNREQDRLQIDWGRLQLEQSTWATHSRIESLARERLDLVPPKDEQIVVVEQPAAQTRARDGSAPGAGTDERDGPQSRDGAEGRAEPEPRQGQERAVAEAAGILQVHGGGLGH